MANGGMLIGGLGMGFTLTAALVCLPSSATIVVAKLLPKILEWAKGPLAHLFGDTLNNPHVTVEIGNVLDMIAAPTERFNATVLDVDNGPDGLISRASAGLYRDWGLKAAYAALRHDGILGIWSGFAQHGLADRLEDAGFLVEEVRLRNDECGKGARHVLWLTTRECEAMNRVAASGG